MPDVQEMIGKEVEVTANGMHYRGVLVEVSDVEVHIKSQLQYVSLPASSVTEVRLAEGSNRQWSDTFAVPQEEGTKTFEITEEDEKKGLIP
jgi:hypothetical protein